jgi:hypothetical protein
METKCEEFDLCVGNAIILSVQVDYSLIGISIPSL